MKIHVNWDIAKVLAGSVAFTVVLGVSARKITDSLGCKIKEEHAHNYSSIYGFTRYINRCDSIYNWMIKNKKDYIVIDEEEKNLLNFLNTNDLFSIEENTEKLQKQLKKHTPYTEYEYIKEELDDNRELVEKTDWTKNKILYLDELTGNARDCSYSYTAYKVEKELDNYVLVKKENVNLLDEKDEYPYIKSNYYEIIKNDYKIDLEKEKVNYEKLRNK